MTRSGAAAREGAQDQGASVGSPHRWNDARAAAVVDLLTAGSAVVVTLAAGSLVELAAKPVALYVCITALAILASSLKRRPHSTGHIVLASAFAFWYAVPGVLALCVSPSALELLPEPTTDADLLTAARALASFQFAALLAFHCRAQRSGKRWREPIGAYRLLPAVLCGSFLLGLAPYALLGSGLSTTVEDILESRATEKAWASTSQLGTEISAFTAVTSSLLIGGSMLLLVSAQCLPLRRLTRAALLLLGLLGSTLVYFDQGTRSVFALIVVPPLALAFRRLYAKTPRMAVASAVLAAGLMVVVLQFQMLYRSAWTRESLRGGLFTDLVTMHGTADFFSETVYACYLVPGERDYFRESVALQFLIGPIPRVLWPEKPVFEMIWFYSKRRANVDIYEGGGNILPGVVAQQYMSWGFGTVVLTALLMGYCAAAIDRRIAAGGAVGAGRSPEEAVMVMALVWLGVSYRLLSPGFLYPVLAAFGMLKASKVLGRAVAAQPAPASASRSSARAGGATR